VLDDAGGVRLVLAGASDPVLTAAAHVVAALASRSTAPPRLSATYAGAAGRPALDGASVLAVGVSASTAAAARVASTLGLAAAPAPVGRGLAQPLALVEEVALGGSAGHQLLWIDGNSPAALSLAGDALYRGGLTGSAVSVDADGRVRPVGALGPGAEPAPVTAVKVVIALAACLLVLAVAWQAWRPRPEAA